MKNRLTTPVQAFLILKKLNVKELSGAPPKALPEHENIRGKDYYK